MPIFSVKSLRQKTQKKHLISILIVLYIVTIIAYFITKQWHFAGSIIFCIQLLLALIYSNFVCITFTKNMMCSDKLTGLKNRNLLHEDLRKCILKLDVFAVMFIDFDDFKVINDTKGHDTGDLILKTFGESLLELNLNISGYRYGGDEFVIIIGESLEENIKKIQLLEKNLNNKEKLNFSYGISKYPDDIKNFSNPNKIISKMLKISDQRMYRKKEEQKKK